MQALLQQLTVNKATLAILSLGVAFAGASTSFEDLPCAKTQSVPMPSYRIERSALPPSTNVQAQHCYELGLVHSHMCDHEDAVHAFDQAIELDPTFAAAWFERAGLRLVINTTRLWLTTPELLALRRRMHQPTTIGET
jgi:hypothetical protein